MRRRARRRRRLPTGRRIAVQAGQMLQARRGRGRRRARLPRGARRLRCAGLSRQPRHLHARRVRRPRRARAARRRRAAHRRQSTRRPSARALPAALVPAYTHDWEIGVLYGPHGAPDFFTDDDIDDVLRHRLGGALQLQPHRRPPDRPEAAWARTDGGEAGLHPSNIHDNAYAVGAVDFTGDMPIILGPDGPSLGGFVCPAVHRRRPSCGRWASCKPGDTVRFAPSDAGAGRSACEAAQDARDRQPRCRRAAPHRRR